MLTSGDFVLIEEIINEDLFLCHIYKKHNFQNLFTVPCESKLFNIAYVPSCFNIAYVPSCFNIAYMPSCLNAQRKLEEIPKRLFLRKVVSISYKSGHVLISILHDITE